jgi:YVTN family beta-propeller protein
MSLPPFYDHLLQLPRSAFTAEDAKAIGSCDPAKQKVDWIMGTGQNRTHMISVSDDIKHIYTTNVASGTVSILEKSTRTSPDFGGPPPGAGPGPREGAPPPSPMPRGPMALPEVTGTRQLIPVGHGGEGFDVSPDRKEIWVANAQDGTVSIIDIASKKVTATLPANYKGTNRLKLTPDGKRVLLSARTLVILDAATHKEVKRLSDVHADAGIQIDPRGEKAYVSCNRDSYVAVIDLKTLQQPAKSTQDHNQTGWLGPFSASSHSSRRAVRGSSEAARCAGTSAAAIPIKISVTGVAA